MGRGKGSHHRRLEWCFTWECPRCCCDTTWLVSEFPVQSYPAVARCRRCTSLMPVRSVHRRRKWAEVEMTEGQEIEDQEGVLQ